MALADEVKSQRMFHDQSVVIDIGGSDLSREIKATLETRLLRPSGGARPLLPTALLYNDHGMDLWEKITHLPDYYQTTTEIKLLKLHGQTLARSVAPGSVLLDIGSGESRKIEPFLDALEAAQIPVTYFALDLSKPALEKSIRTLTQKYRFVRLFGLWGTFEDAREWAARETVLRDSAIWYISLDSFFGNDHFDDAVDRLKVWRALMRPRDRMLLGMDGQESTAAVWASYHDHSNIFEEFMRNGLRYTNEVLGYTWFKDSEWKIQGFLEEGPPLKHKFVFEACCDVLCEQLGLKFAMGDKIDCYEVFKYGPDDMGKQFAATGLKQITALKASCARFYDYLLMSDCGINTDKASTGGS